MAEKSVNDAIHESLIEHEVHLRRVDGDRRRKIEKRIDLLGADLKALMIKIDPFVTERTDARERRLKKLDEESAKLISEAYGEISSGMTKDLKRLARAESETVVKTIAEELP